MAASEFTCETGVVTPKDIAGPRVELGGRCFAKRPTAGSFGIQVLRGDGGDPEAYTYTVRTKLLGPYAAGELALLQIGCADLPMPDFTPRRYRLRVSTLDGEDLTVLDAFIATSPYTEAGRGETTP